MRLKLLTVIQICSLILISFVIANGISLYTKYRCSTNYPATAFIEEDLEKYLMSTEIEVYNFDTSKYGYAVYGLIDHSTNKNYKCAYEVKQNDWFEFKSYKWQLLSLIEVN